MEVLCLRSWRHMTPGRSFTLDANIATLLEKRGFVKIVPEKKVQSRGKPRRKRTTKTNAN